MTNLSEYLDRGERARLFPVLADTSKEGRCTSIFLSCLSHVHEFGEQMLKSVGQRVGKTCKYCNVYGNYFLLTKTTKRHIGRMA